MSLQVDGVWAGGVWASTVWADGVWREGAPGAAIQGFVIACITLEPAVDSSCTTTDTSVNATLELN